MRTHTYAHPSRMRAAPVTSPASYNNKNQWVVKNAEGPHERFMVERFMVEIMFRL